jgi:hypothetical protein
MICGCEHKSINLWLREGLASAMFEAQSINAEHKDLIHDVAYDFYGQRMATCSSDQFVKVKKGSYSIPPLHVLALSRSLEMCL